MASEPWPSYGRLQARLRRLGTITLADFRQLGEEGERIFQEDNRKGILSQQDRYGNRMDDTTYRGSSSRRTVARRGLRFGEPSGTPKGRNFAGHTTGSPYAHGNLPTSEYKKLTGPPLAPRGEQSRVIANYETQHGQDGSTFFVQGAWKDVVSTKGVHFLGAHFKGKGRLPVRDLAGIRPWGMAQIRKATNVWLRWLVAGKP